MAVHDLTVADIIDNNALVRGPKTAFINGEQRWTFARFREDVDWCAATLAALNLQKGDRIALISENSYEFFLVFGAAARLGLILVLINIRLNPEELQTIFEDCQPTAVICTAKAVPVVSEVSQKSASVQHHIVLGEEQVGFTPLSDLKASCVQGFDRESSQDDPLIIIHTAAVDGRPKGAVLTHGNILAACAHVILPLRIDADSIYIELMPLFHVMGLEMALAVFFAGGCNIIMPRYDAEAAAGTIAREQVTITATVPPMLSNLLDAAEAGGHSLESLQTVASLFDHPDNIQRCQEMTGARFWSGYGQTETMGYITLGAYDECRGSSGKQGPMVRLALVDDYDRPVGAGKAGEIVVRGPITFQKYWNLSEETDNAFRGGWHHTGDIGRLDENGYLWYLKRKAEKELIKSGGENVYPAEVEKALLKHPEVEEACVFGVPDKQWGEIVKAVCVPKGGCNLVEEELIEFVGCQIARYKKPKDIEFVKTMPKTEEGLIDIDRIKQDYC